MTGSASLRIAGGIMPPALIGRIQAGEVAPESLKPATYHLAAQETVRDAAARSWSYLRGAWEAWREADAKRGPTGGFTLGPRAAEMTLLDLYEMIDGPLGEHTCLMGYLSCPLGGCVLGNAVGSINDHVRNTLGKQRIADLGD